MDTINRLLKKQPPKRGRRANNDVGESGQDEEPEQERANPLFLRYTQNSQGSSIALPDEWLSAPVGTLFAGESLPKAPMRPFNGRMVEEIA
jgi:Ino eighty subunit 2